MPSYAITTTVCTPPGASWPSYAITTTVCTPPGASWPSYAITTTVCTPPGASWPALGHDQSKGGLEAARGGWGNRGGHSQGGQTGHRLETWWYLSEIVGVTYTGCCYCLVCVHRQQSRPGPHISHLLAQYRLLDKNSLPLIEKCPIDGIIISTRNAHCPRHLPSTPSPSSPPPVMNSIAHLKFNTFNAYKFKHLLPPFIIFFLVLNFLRFEI